MSFLEELAAGLSKAAKQPNILNYKTNSPIHEAFHSSEKVGRILKGGNRSGKSVAGAVESIWRATGRHPFQKTHDVPTRGRIVTVDRDYGAMQIIKPLLQQWTPPSELINGSFEDSFNNRSLVMSFRNGSTIDIKTHQQAVEAFAGVPRHWTWFDEECPQAIFNECRLRLIDFNGDWWMTMTPVEGQDWIFDRFITTQQKNVELFEVDITDNPHLSKDALRTLEEDLTDEEKEVRQKGTFVPKGGIILTEFKLDVHVVPSKEAWQIPKNWEIYASCDHGFNNPTAWLWHAVSPDLDVITFREHYKRKMVIKDHVTEIKKMNKSIGRQPQLYMGDPSMAQKSAITGTSPLQTYRDLGIPLMQAKRDVSGRIDKMNEYLKYRKWYITEDCPMTIKEARGYHFKAYHSPKIADRNNQQETPNPKNNHAMDSSGYFFTFLPFLSDDVKLAPKKHSLTETNMEDFPWQVDTAFMQLEEGRDVPDFAFGEIP